MTDLKSKLTRMAAFDEAAFDDTFQPETKIDLVHEGIEEGARWQSERLQPLLAALIECAGVLAKIDDGTYRYYEQWDGDVCIPAHFDVTKEPLARLTALAQGEE